MAARYWVGGTGTWNTTTTNWSATNGGAGGATAPGAADDVWFTSNSGTGTCTVAVAVTVLSINHSSPNVLLNTAGFAINCTASGFTASGTAAVTLGASVVTTVGWSWSSSGALTANTSRINCTNGNFAGGSKTYYDVRLTSTSTFVMSIGGNNTFSILYCTGGASFAARLNTGGSTQTIAAAGTLSLTGNSLVYRLWVESSTFSAPAGVTVTLTNVDFTSCSCSGGATFSGTSVGNALGNSGITFTAAVTRYAKAAGNWSSTATWAATSGGAAGASAPICHDTVMMDATAGVGSYIVDRQRACGTLNCTGFTRTLQGGTYPLEVFGNATFVAGMTFSGLAFSNPSFAASTVTTASKTFQSFTVNSNVSLSGALIVTGQLLLTATLSASVFDVTANNLSAGASAVLSGSGNWTITGTGTVWDIPVGANLSAFTTANITFSDTTTAARIFNGGSKTYNSIIIGGTTGSSVFTINGNNTISTLRTTKTVANTVQFAVSSTQSIQLVSLIGAAGKLVTLKAVSGTCILTANAIDPATDYLSVTGITANPDLLWYVGANSVNGGSNTRVYFSGIPPKGAALFDLGVF